MNALLKLIGVDEAVQTRLLFGSPKTVAYFVEATMNTFKCNHGLMQAKLYHDSDETLTRLLPRMVRCQGGWHPYAGPFVIMFQTTGGDTAACDVYTFERFCLFIEGVVSDESIAKLTIMGDSQLVTAQRFIEEVKRLPEDLRQKFADRRFRLIFQ